jgi:5'-methylthioadenosine phosphorylase
MKNKILKTNVAFIGGSSTYSLNFPEDLKMKGVKVLGKQIYTTPFGDSPEFTFFEIDGETYITLKMHGWRKGIKRSDASLQMFWVFEKAGVKDIIVEGGVGAINRNFRLCDFIIPNDYLDFSLRKDIHLYDDYLLIMRDPICPELSQIIEKTASDLFPGRNIHKGIYAVTDGRHFESPAEVRMIEKLGGDVIGQSLCPEVYLAREIGACYAGIYLIVNRAEGIKPEWSHKELKNIFYGEAINMGSIIIESLKKIKNSNKKTCKCRKLRKKTLLK